MSVAWIGGLLAGSAVLVAGRAASTGRGGPAPAVHRRSGAPVPPASARRPVPGRRPIAARRRSIATGAAVAATAGLVGGPAAVVVVATALVVARAHLLRRRRSRAARAVDQGVPDTVDLFVVAAAAGHPVSACLELVAPRAPLAVRAALVAAHARAVDGAPLAQALDGARPALGPLGGHLVDALITAHRSGAPLPPALERVAAIARDRRRRTAEEAARRLPVTLLFPLVCCVLPAFALLAVVPLLAASLGSLSP
ncbi:MAG TPA: type II secretion system F family protein [Aquihabitans sp.]|nr:type II secretion system F family protein [Aquihabitans sp.]